MSVPTAKGSARGKVPSPKVHLKLVLPDATGPEAIDEHAVPGRSAIVVVDPQNLDTSVCHSGPSDRESTAKAKANHASLPPFS
jgi:hypothetical protein